MFNDARIILLKAGFLEHFTNMTEQPAFSQWYLPFLDFFTKGCPHSGHLTISINLTPLGYSEMQNAKKNYESKILKQDSQTISLLIRNRNTYSHDKVLKMNVSALLAKGLILFIISITILVVLSIPHSFYRIIDLAYLGATVLLIVCIFVLGSYFYANRTK